MGQAEAWQIKLIFSSGAVYKKLGCTGVFIHELFKELLTHFVIGLAFLTMLAGGDPIVDDNWKGGYQEEGVQTMY